MYARDLYIYTGFARNKQDAKVPDMDCFPFGNDDPFHCKHFSIAYLDRKNNHSVRVTTVSINQPIRYIAYSILHLKNATLSHTFAEIFLERMGYIDTFEEDRVFVYLIKPQQVNRDLCVFFSNDE